MTNRDTPRPVRVRDLFGDAPHPRTASLTLRDPRPDGRVLKSDEDVAEALDLLAAGYPLLNHAGDHNRVRLNSAVGPGDHDRMPMVLTRYNLPAGPTLGSLSVTLLVFVVVTGLVHHTWSAVSTVLVLLGALGVALAAHDRRRLARSDRQPTLHVCAAPFTSATRDLAERAGDAAADVKDLMERLGRTWAGSDAADELGHIRRVLVEIAHVPTSGLPDAEAAAARSRIGAVLADLEQRVRTLNDYADALSALDVTVAGSQAHTQMLMREAEIRLDMVEAGLAQRPSLAGEVAVIRAVAAEVDNLD